MDDIKLFAKKKKKKKKKLGLSESIKNNIRPGYRNGIGKEKYATFIMLSEKR